MGYWKEKSLYPENTGKTICFDCVSDSYLKKYVKNYAVSSKCSYCKRELSDKLISINLDSLVQLILEGLSSEYEASPFSGEAAIYLEEQIIPLEYLLYYYKVTC